MAKRILANPVYVGLIHLHGRTYPGEHEPIVDERTWATVAARLARDSVVPSRALGTPAHALRGLVACDHCGRALYRVTSRGVPRLRCKAMSELKICGGPGQPSVAKVEAVVLERVAALVSSLRDDSIERAERVAKRTRAGVDVARLRRELARDEAALTRLTTSWSRREISETAYTGSARELEGHLGALRQVLGRAEAEAAAPAPRAAIAAAGSLVELWPAMTTPGRNIALGALVSQVRVRRGTEPLADRVEVLWL